MSDMVGVCSKAIWVLVNLLCIVFFSLQLVHILEGYAKPTVTRTWEEEVFLQDIDFPLTIKICVIPGFNQTALNESGYYDTWFYFLGQSAFNDSIYGWAGHTEDLGTVDTVDNILDQVSNYQIEDIFGELYVWTRDQELVNIPFEYLDASRVNYPHNCRSLALSEVPELKSKAIRELYVVIWNLGNYSVEVQLKDSSLDCKRNIRDHHSYSIGDTIKLEQDGVSTAYIVDISQRVFVEEDPTNTCRDYPNADFSTYAQCDDQFMRKLLPNITPIWLAEDLAHVTTEAFDEFGTYGRTMADMIDGSLVSDCPLPCKTTHTQAKLFNTMSSADTEIDIAFSSKVKITRTDMKRPTLSSFLSEVRECQKHFENIQL